LDGNQILQALVSAADRRAYFLLLRQKKVAKEKATPGYAVGCADSPALLEGPGGCGTLLGYAKPQTVLADCPRSFSVARRFTWGPGKSSRHGHSAQNIVCCGRPRKTAIFARRPQHPIRFTRPLGRCRATQTGAEKGRALSEGQSPELRSPRASRVAQGTRAAGTDPGSPFLCLLSFGDAKESNAARQARKTAHQQAHKLEESTKC